MTLEYIESYHPADRSLRAVLKGAPGLSYEIVISKNEVVTSNSMARGALGSIRYYSHRSYKDAMDHGIKWAKRRMSKENN